MQTAMDLITSISRSAVPYWLYSKFMFAIQPLRDNTFEATKIVEGLWIGDLRSGCANLEDFEERKIKLVVSAVYGCSARFPFDMDYERANLLDVNGENISDDIERLLPKIREYITSGKSVLIHCMAGRSRSVTIATAYLIRYHKMGAEEALKFIKEKRTSIDPNPGYKEQLELFEKKVLEDLELNNEEPEFDYGNNEETVFDYGNNEEPDGEYGEYGEYGVEL